MKPGPHDAPAGANDHQAESPPARRRRPLRGRGRAEVYNCGNCTATCSLVGQSYNFPRKCMHALQMGMEKKLEGSLEPWLCYYCGECSAECPREAQPGETMMSLRRWLTARYDFTGIGRMFYRKPWTEIVGVVIVALLTALASPSSACSAATSISTTARMPSCRGASSTSSTGAWRRCFWLFCSPT